MIEEYAEREGQRRELLELELAWGRGGRRSLWGGWSPQREVGGASWEVVWLYKQREDGVGGQGFTWARAGVGYAHWWIGVVERSVG
jgi:hypothetical protein